MYTDMLIFFGALTAVIVVIGITVISADAAKRRRRIRDSMRRR